MDLGARLTMLEILQHVRRHGRDVLNDLPDGPPPAKPDPAQLRAMDALDWRPALRNVNAWFDRAVAALRVEGRARRETELDKFSNDLKAVKDKATDPANKLSGENVGNVVIALLMPAFNKVQPAQDRSEQVSRNLHVAFALAAYRRDAGGYPPKLDDLAPKYLAAVPGDLFLGKPLVYRPAGNGYLLYSVGTNGLDDGGRSYEDDPPADDLTVRMPLPELKAKK